MTEDLTKRYKNYALYLPSLQYGYADFVASNSDKDVREGNLPTGFSISDLNFLNPKSKLWTCGNVLYSGGQYGTERIERRNIVAERNWANTVVVGDSGGFQLGTREYKNKREQEHMDRFEFDPQAMFENWHSCGYRERTLTWLELYTDYAMTLDMVLWAEENYAKSKNYTHASQSHLRKLSIQQLIDLSVDNLRYFADNRGKIPGRSTKFLSVIQDIGVVNGVDTGMEWYKAVKDFDFEGWSLGSEAGNVPLNTLKWLRRLLDDGKLERTEWVHLLMKSPPRLSVIFTAIQHAVSKAANREIQLSYDSSSPHQTAGLNTSLNIIPELTSDLRTWTMSSERIKQSYDIATGKEQLTWEIETPLAKFFTPNDLVYKQDAYDDSRTDPLASNLLVNHNIYAFHRAAVDACDLAFHPQNKDYSRIPTEISDAIACIEQYFVCDNPDVLHEQYAKAFNAI